MVYCLKNLISVLGRPDDHQKMPALPHMVLLGFGTANETTSDKLQPTLTQGGWVEKTMEHNRKQGEEGGYVVAQDGNAWNGRGINCRSGSMCKYPSSTRNVQCAGCNHWCHLECATATVAGFKCMFCYNKFATDEDALYD